MPKKFQGENSKAVIAKARRSEKVAAEKEKKEKAAEDALWKEDDKLICKKFQRKEDKERNRLEQLEKKQEKKILEEQENAEFNAGTKTPTQKVSVFQLQKMKEDQQKQSEKVEKENSYLEAPLEENLNRLQTDTISASGIDAAVAALSVSGSSDGAVDHHPEKRMAAAFREFETSRMPHIKKENPTMRHSQLKQILHKEWQKSPQNPLNQRS